MDSGWRLGGKIIETEPGEDDITKLPKALEKASR